MLDYWRFIKKEPRTFVGVFDRIVEDMIAARNRIAPAHAIPELVTIVATPEREDNNIMGPCNSHGSNHNAHTKG